MENSFENLSKYSAVFLQNYNKSIEFDEIFSQLTEQCTDQYSKLYLQSLSNIYDYLSEKKSTALTSARELFSRFVKHFIESQQQSDQESFLNTMKKDVLDYYQLKENVLQIENERNKRYKFPQLASKFDELNTIMHSLEWNISYSILETLEKILEEFGRILKDNTSRKFLSYFDSLLNYIKKSDQIDIHPETLKVLSAIQQEFKNSLLESTSQEQAERYLSESERMFREFQDKLSVTLDDPNSQVRPTTKNSDIQEDSEVSEYIATFFTDDEDVDDFAEMEHLNVHNALEAPQHEEPKSYMISNTSDQYIQHEEQPQTERASAYEDDLSMLKAFENAEEPSTEETKLEYVEKPIEEEHSTAFPIEAEKLPIDEHQAQIEDSDFFKTAEERVEPQQSQLAPLGEELSQEEALKNELNGFFGDSPIGPSQQPQMFVESTNDVVHQNNNDFEEEALKNSAFISKLDEAAQEDHKMQQFVAEQHSAIASINENDLEEAFEGTFRDDFVQETRETVQETREMPLKQKRAVAQMSADVEDMHLEQKSTADAPLMKKQSVAELNDEEEPEELSAEAEASIENFFEQNFGEEPQSVAKIEVDDIADWDESAGELPPALSTSKRQKNDLLKKIEEAPSLELSAKASESLSFLDVDDDDEGRVDSKFKQIHENEVSLPQFEEVRSFEAVDELQQIEATTEFKSVGSIEEAESTDEQLEEDSSTEIQDFQTIQTEEEASAETSIQKSMQPVAKASSKDDLPRDASGRFVSRKTSTLTRTKLEIEEPKKTLKKRIEKTEGLERASNLKEIERLLNDIFSYETSEVYIKELNEGLKTNSIDMFIKIILQLLSEIQVTSANKDHSDVINLLKEAVSILEEN